MSKAGPLTRSRSRRPKPAELDSNTYDRLNASNGPSLNVKASAHGALGRRLHSDEIVIGLALGSPGQSPLPLLPSDDRDVDVSHEFNISYSPKSPENTIDSLGTVTDIGTGGQGIKRKGSKWKSIGGFFGRKESTARAARTTPFYQLDKAPEYDPARQNVVQERINVSRRKRADSDRSKVDIDLSQSAAKGESYGILRRNSSRRKGLRRRKVEEMKPELLRLHNALSAHAEVEGWQTSSTGSRRPMASLLQVEIPKIELDRYSVMFSDLLGPDQQRRPQPKRQSSALAWKQGSKDEALPGTEPTALDANQLSVDGLPKIRHGRDDSNSSKSSKTPSFSLFPASTATPRQSANSIVNKPLPKPSPLGRSTTAPNALAPPNRPRIQKSKSEDQEQVLIVVHKSADLPLTSTASIRRHSLDPPNLSTNSTQASFHECTESSGLPDASLSEDPQMSNYNGAGQECAFPTRKSSIRKPQQPLEEPDSSNHTGRDSNGTAAEVSVARQISITRRQRQLVVPIAPKLARQPRQPTLVNGISTPAARKSHHLTLEDA